MIRFDCHLVYNGDNPFLAHMQNEQGHERLQMQPFDALVVKVEKIANEDESIVSLKAEIFLNGKLVATS